MNKSLSMIGKNMEWLQQKLAEHHMNFHEVLLMIGDENGKCTIIPKKKRNVE